MGIKIMDSKRILKYIPKKKPLKALR